MLGSVIYEHLYDFFSKWKSSMVSIFYKPLPCLIGVVPVRAYLEILFTTCQSDTLEINITNCTDEILHS